MTKQSLYKANSLAYFSAEMHTPVAAKLTTKKSFGGMDFVIFTKAIYKVNSSKELSFVIISARMVPGVFLKNSRRHAGKTHNLLSAVVPPHQPKKGGGFTCGLRTGL